MQFEYRSKVFDIEGVSEDDYIYKSILRADTFYEVDLLEYIESVKSFFPSVRGRNVAIDIGANIGNHSIFLSSFIADHLIAIEPNPDVLPKLRRNLSKNGCNYTLYECAVGESESKGSIVVPKSMNDNIGATRVDPKDTDGKIEVLTLDSVISSWKKNEKNDISVSLIKIDVEGMEPQVLKGAKDTIIEYTPHIFAEAATKEEFERINDCLQPLGYRRLPGKWASTSVYHFVKNPPFSLLLTCQYMRLRRTASKAMYRLKRRFSGR